MDRRRFLKDIGLWSAGVTAALPVLNSGREAYALQSRKSVLAVAKGTDYTALVKKVLDPLGGITAFVKPGQSVVVKPNIAFDRKPELAGCTHPEVVKAMVELCLEAGAAKVDVFDRTCDEERRCYDNSGIKAAVESLNTKKAVCSYIDDRKFVPVNIKRGKSLFNWEYYKPALEANCYINIPVAKNHGKAKLTLGLKNIMGVIGGKRGMIHWSLDQRIADLNTALLPRLTVIDATRILLANGPSGGNIEDVKVMDTLIASADTVAADAYATTMFGMKPNDIASTVAGHELGLGQMDLGKIEVVKV